MEKYHNNISLAIKSALKFNKQECINNNDKDLDMSCDFKCWPAPFGIIGTVCTAIILSLITIITIGGNFLVLIAFGVKQKLRESKNFFIVSLAFTDLLIGMISLPLFSVYILVGFWPPQLGPILCDLWLSIDHTVCLVSQLTVLSITIDRFCSVRFPAHYQIIKDRNKTILIIIGTWAISALIFFIPIFGWEHFIDKRDLLPGECKVQFLKDPLFNTSLIICYFWIPLIILIYLYGSIYRTAWTLSKKSMNKRESRLNLLNKMNQAKEESRKGHQIPRQLIQMRPRETDNNNYVIDEEHSIQSKDNDIKVASKPKNQLRNWFHRQRNDKEYQEGKAKKALRTISMILGAFLMCWTPYHVISIVNSFYPASVNGKIYMISYFLCYANSSINPLCYAASNRQFRKTFKRVILHGDLSRK